MGKTSDCAIWDIKPRAAGQPSGTFTVVTHHNGTFTPEENDCYCFDWLNKGETIVVLP